MSDISQIIFSLWCIPVIIFIALPLFVGCFWVLYRVFDVFKPIAGQENKPIELSHPGKKTT